MKNNTRQGMPKICQIYAQDILKIFTKYAQDMPKVCPRYKNVVRVNSGQSRFVFFVQNKLKLKIPYMSVLDLTRIMTSRPSPQFLGTW